jgi:hypothetical protein
MGSIIITKSQYRVTQVCLHPIFECMLNNIRLMKVVIVMYRLSLRMDTTYIV